jgi:hypothetical protein
MPKQPSTHYTMDFVISANAMLDRPASCLRCCRLALDKAGRRLIVGRPCRVARRGSAATVANIIGVIGFADSQLLRARTLSEASQVRVRYGPWNTRPHPILMRHPHDRRIIETASFQIEGIRVTRRGRIER